jgi:iron complex outermembrane receptor protein
LIRSPKTWSLPWAVVLLGLPLHGALAADAAATDTAPSSAAAAQAADTLQEVVVTATHRAESAKDVPVSTSALSGDSLTVLGTGGEDIKQLAFAVPSLNIESSNGRAFPRLYIRGYGNTDYHDFASQPVGLVVDDIDQENAALKGFPIFDQEDIEVLRGPQGTLFGRNAPAGVVKFESAKPELNSSDGFISLADGTFNTATVQLVDNVPIGSNQAIRVSMQGQHKDDWIDDPVNDTTLGGYNDWAARVQWLLKLSDDFSMLLNVHGHSMDGSSTIFRANIFSQGTNSLVPGFNPAFVYTDGPNRQNLGTIGANAHLTWTLPSVTLQSITGYESVQRYMSLGDIDGGFGPGNVFCQPDCTGVAPSGPGYIPFAVETSAGLLHHEQFTQEFRVLTNGDGPLQGQAGLYAFYEDVTADDNDYCVPGGAAAVCANQNLWTLQDTTVSTQRNNAEAVFGSVSYTVIDPLKLTAGVRYTHDAKKFMLDYSNTVPPPSPPNSASADANNVSWDASGVFRINDDINWYARIATGFRAPSFGSPAAGLPIQVARSETNTSYETGIKADLLDHRMRLSWDVYYYEVRNQQLSAVGGQTNTTILLNADKTFGRGTELQLDYHPIPGLTFNLGGSVNVTRIDDPGLAVGPCFNWSFAAPTAACTLINPVNAAGNVLINGNPLPEAAKYVGDASVRYDYTVPGSGDVYVYSDLQSRSSMLATLYASREFTLPNLTQVGLRLGYIWGGNGRYEAAVYCRNCVNQVRQVGVIDFADFLGYVNDPRVIGVSFKSEF